MDDKLVTAIGSLAALALDNVRLHQIESDKLRLEHELDMARAIQQSLQPRDFACRPFMEAAGDSLPCYQIGGDYFDLAPIGNQECLALISDVSGKGPAAALRAAMVQGNVKALCRGPIHVPELMSCLNDCYRSRCTDTGFVTAFAAVLSSNGLLRYSNGGHNAAILIR